MHRIYCAADCGQQVNPDTVVAQIESSVVFGLSALMWGEINIQNGRVQQTNFDDYRVARITDVAAHRLLRDRQQRSARRHRRAGNCTGGSGRL